MIIIFLFLIVFLFIIIIFILGYDYSESEKTVSSDTQKRPSINRYKKDYDQEEQERKRLVIQQNAEKVAAKINSRPEFIEDFGFYISTFDVWTKIPRIELEERFKSYNQDLPDIFELNDYLHKIGCEATYVNNYYMVVPIGTINFEEKKKIKL